MDEPGFKRSSLVQGGSGSTSRPLGGDGRPRLLGRAHKRKRNPTKEILVVPSWWARCLGRLRLLSGRGESTTPTQRLRPDSSIRLEPD